MNTDANQSEVDHTLERRRLYAPEMRDVEPKYITTKTGVVISGGWTPKPPPMTDDAARIQQAMRPRNAEAARAGLAELCFALIFVGAVIAAALGMQ